MNHKQFILKMKFGWRNFFEEIVANRINESPQNIHQTQTFFSFVSIKAGVCKLAYTYTRTHSFSLSVSFSLVWLFQSTVYERIWIKNHIKVKWISTRMLLFTEMENISIDTLCIYENVLHSLPWLNMNLALAGFGCWAFWNIDNNRCVRLIFTNDYNCKKTSLWHTNSTEIYEFEIKKNYYCPNAIYSTKVEQKNVFRFEYLEILTQKKTTLEQSLKWNLKEKKNLQSDQTINVWSSSFLLFVKFPTEIFELHSFFYSKYIDLT